MRRSTLIAHKQDSGTVAVVLAEKETKGLQGPTGIRLNVSPVAAKFGDITAFAADAPFLMATVDYSQKTIQISLKGRRQRLDTSLRLTDGGDVQFAPAGETELAGDREPPEFIAPAESLLPPDTEADIIFNPDAHTYRVRWWPILS